MRIGVSLEIVVRLFFTPITHLSTLPFLLYNEVKNGGADNERNKIPHISG